MIQAAIHGDPGRVSEPELERRRLLGFPPAATVAVVGGAAAPAFIDRLGGPVGIEVTGPDDGGSWLLRSGSPGPLLDALGTVERPPGRLRLWVDPVRTR